MHPSTNHTSEITVRLADHNDARALLDLAALDSAQVPAGALLVAESDGELVAALSLDGGRPIADPFRGTALIVQMLELRAAQMRGGSEHQNGIVDRVRSLIGLQHAT